MEDEYLTKESMESAEKWFISREREVMQNQLDCIAQKKDLLDYLTYNY